MTKLKTYLLIFGGIVFIFLIFFSFKINQFYQKIYKKNPSIIIAQKTSFNFLLLGYGGGQHEGTYLTDSMILAHVDLKNKKVKLISLPRDLWIKIPTKSGDSYHMKINALYQLDLYPYIKDNYPDIDWKAIKNAGFSTIISLGVYQATGIKIDHYLAVDFTGFTKAIDALGGVDVDVKKAFEDPQYPIDGKETDLCGKEEIFKLAEPFISPPYNNDEREKIFREKPEIAEFVKNATDSPELAFPCRYEKLKFTAGLTHMNGTTALKYVRSRHGIEDGGDFGRSSRQQEFLMAVKDKILNISIVTKIIPLLDQLKENIETDVSPEIIKKLSKEVIHVKEYTVVNFVLSTDNYLNEFTSVDGQYVLISKDGLDKWDQVRNGVKNFILEVKPSISLTPAP